MRCASLFSWLCPPAALLAAACSGTPSAPDASLTVLGSAGAPPASARVGHPSARTGLSFATVDVTNGDPASMSIGMYALYISKSANCSDPVLVQAYDAVSVKDFVAAPVLFTGTPDAGTYPCVIIKMSDVISFTSATAFGTCATGTTYQQDIYREGETPYWKDADGTTDIVGQGTDPNPHDDHVAIVMTTDTTAAMARGFSTNQLVQLESPLVVPGSSTFYWNAAGSVSTADGRPCGLERGQPAFR